MALTIDQWNAKIRKWVPSDIFIDHGVEKEVITSAFFYAVAAMFQQIDQDKDDQFNTTFITRSTAPIEDLLGDERGKIRFVGESDANYAARIQAITSMTDTVNIKAAVDKLLLIAGCLIKESPRDNPYANRSTFCNRDDYVTAFGRNFFTLITPRQVHAPYSFSDSAYSDSDFVGTDISSNSIYTSIIALVNSMKAFGVLYRIVESTRSNPN